MRDETATTVHTLLSFLAYETFTVRAPDVSFSGNHLMGRSDYGQQPDDLINFEVPTNDLPTQQEDYY